MSDKMIQASRLMTVTIRQNRSALPEPLAGEEVAEWVTFAETMQPIMHSAAGLLAARLLADGEAPRKVLDVASSQGLFGFAVSQAAPACEIVALDFPSVLEVTAAHARAPGIPLTLLPGNAFTAELGSA